MRYNWIFLKLFFIFYLNICSYCMKKKSYKNYKLLLLEGQKPDIMTLIEYLNTFDDSATYAVREDRAQVILKPSLMTSFQNFAKEADVKVKVLAPDYSKVLNFEKVKTLRDKKGGNFSWNGYYGVDDIYSYIKALQKKYPHMSRLIQGGESHLGQKILGLRIMTNVPYMKLRTKPVIMIESGIHGREWLTPSAITYFMHKLLSTDSNDFRNLRNSFDWHIFPTVNPDGYRYSLLTERMWRKSRSRSKTSICVGADLNRNWDYKFGTAGVSADPCSYQSYSGAKAFSEVESRSLSSYISNLDRLLAYIAVHSYGNCIILPEGVIIGNRSQMEQIANSAMRRSGIHYKIGSSEEIFGEKVSGTSKDWVYKEKKPPIVFAYELKDVTFFTPSERIMDSVEETSLFLEGLFKEAQLYGY